MKCHMLHIDNFVCVCKIMKIVDIYFHTRKNFQSTKNYSQLSNWNNLHLIKCICCLMRMYRFGNNMIITNYFSDSFISYLLKSSAIFLQKLNLKQNLFYRLNDLFWCVNSKNDRCTSIHEKYKYQDTILGVDGRDL